MKVKKFPFLAVTAPYNFSDQLIDLLWDYDISGLEEIDGYTAKTFMVYFHDHEERSACEEHLDSVFALKRIDIVHGSCRETDWQHLLHGGFEPVKLSRITVEPYVPERAAARDQQTVWIYPGQGFGTGTHSTTHMCLEYMEDMSLAGKEFLDYGCGSGILSISARRLGAASGVAIDNDHRAVENARYNFEINQIGNEVSLLHGSVETVQKHSPGKQFPVMLANLNSTVIPPLLEAGLSDFVEPGGLLLLSGIRLETIGKISALFERYSLEETSWKRDRKWTTVLLKKSAKTLR